MNVSTTIWIVTLGILAAAFILDFVVVDARPHVFGPKQAARWVVAYIIAALVFATFVWNYFGAEYGQQFLAGWITEYSLSVDNLFVFIVLMSSFAVPEMLKHRVLLIGVAIAIVLRGVLIVVGAAAIARFTATFYVFAAFLMYTAVSVWRSHDEEPDPEGNALIRLVEKYLPTSRNYAGTKFTVKIDGKRFITPLFVVILAVGTTDLLFALDSIPAVFGLTKEPYLVFAANAFALMGLRQLYFLLDGLLSKIIYLARGLAVILGFIAIKLFLEAVEGTTDLHPPHVTIAQSLMFIATVLGVTVVTSLVAVRRSPELALQSEISQAIEESTEHRGEAIEHLGSEDPSN
ncbi:MAG: TerC/Alx family metal homeostasis membrane protein [Candidatus Nanopelagicales bacterium]|nr:TerC/Alx family metal homeostasis membrane protein [Candidatus Nanopelagicales bacterium]